MDSEWKQCELTDKRDKDPLTPPSAFPPTVPVRLSTRAQSYRSLLLSTPLSLSLSPYIYLSIYIYRTRPGKLVVAGLISSHHCLPNIEILSCDLMKEEAERSRERERERERERRFRSRPISDFEFTARGDELKLN